jgi:hypothetical protein
MTPAENLYRVLLHLYPREFRRAYGELMLQHARDLERAALQRGRLSVSALYLRLVGDGLFNAAAEHLQAVRAANNNFDPTPWPAVLLAAIPGLWLALTRRHADLLGPALSLFGSAYLVLLLIAVPVAWRRARRIPVWALIPAGMLASISIFRFQSGVASLAVPLDSRFSIWALIALLTLALTTLIGFIILRGRRLPGTTFLFIGLLLLSGLLLALLVRQKATWTDHPISYYLAAALTEPAIALLLVAVGLPAARRHNVLALLVVIGGYGTIFLDSDYLWGSPYRDWPGLPFYFPAMILLFFVLAPTGLLRARSRLGRAAALFFSTALFLTARLAGPALVLGQAATILPGDAILSLTVLLSLVIGWILYGNLGDPERKDVPIPSF